MSLTPRSDLTIAQIQAYGAIAIKHNYIQRVLCGLDQFLNVLTYGNLGETMSSRSSRYFRDVSKKEWIGWQKFGAFMCWWLDKIQALHGVKAESGDYARNVLVINLIRADMGLPPVNLYE